MNAHHHKAAFWIGEGVFDGLESFKEFESRVNVIPEELDRGDVTRFSSKGISQLRPSHSTRSIGYQEKPAAMRERFNLPSDGTGIDGIYEDRGGNLVAYQVKYRRKRNLTFAEVSSFLGITEKFTDRVIFTNASSLSEKAKKRSRWYSDEVFNALTAAQFEQIAAWLREQPIPLAKDT